MKRSLVLSLALALAAGAAFAAENSPPLKIRASVSGGYDSNRDLNSLRKDDFFAQETVAANYSRAIDRSSKYRLSYNALNLNYFEATDLNLILNQFGVGYDRLLTPSTVWETDYAFQYLYFPRNESVTSYEHEVRTGLRQRLSKKWTLRTGVGYSDRTYENRLARLASRSPSTDDRGDERHWGDAELIYKARKDLALSTGLEIYVNDSNDLFNDYYDYHGYKLSSGVSWQIDPKWTCFGRVSWEARQYDARPVVNDPQNGEEDDIYVGSLSLYYKVDKNLSLGSSLTYREKTSNDDTQKYSGSLGTLGLYYSF